MAIERINDAFDVPALKSQFDFFKRGCEESQQSIVTLYNSIKSYKGANFSSISAETDKLVTSTTRAAAANDKLIASRTKMERALAAEAKTEQEVVKLITLEEKAQQAANKTKETASKLEVNLQKNKMALITLQDKEQAQLNKSTNAYEILKKQYLDASNLSKQRGAELLIEAEGNERLYKSLLGQDEVYQATTDAAQKYYKQLDLLEVEVGQNQRRVGQYERANAGLSNSINQLTRELPAFSNSMNTGFLAISNNLPIFFDEISKINAQNKELAASGQKPIPVLKQLAGSFFTVGTALSIGVTLLTIYGGKLIELVGGLFDSAEAAKKAAEQQAKLNDLYRESVEIIKELTKVSRDYFKEQENRKGLEILQAQNRERTKLYEAEIKVNDQRAFAAQEAAEQAKREGKELSALNTAYIIAAQSYEEFIKNREVNGYKVDGEDFDKIEESLKKNVEATKKAYTDQEAIVNEYDEAFFALANKRTEYETYQEELRRKLALETARITSEATIAANEDILSYETSTEAQRIASLNRIAAAQRAAAKAELVDVLNNPSSEKEDKLIAQREYAKESKSIELERVKAIYDVELEFYNRSLAAQKEINDLRLAEDQRISTGIVDQEKRTVEERIVAANELLKSKQAQVEAQYEYDKELLSEKAAADYEYKVLEARKNSAIVKLVAEGQQQILDILKSEYEKQAEAQEDALRKIALASQQLQADMAADYSKDTIRFGEELDKKIIEYEDYLQKLATLDKKNQLKQTKVQLVNVETDLRQIDEADYERKLMEVREKMAEATIELNQAITEGEKTEILKRLALYETFEKRYETQLSKRADLEKQYHELLGKTDILQRELVVYLQNVKWERFKSALRNYAELLNNTYAAGKELNDIAFDKQLVQVEELEARQQKAYENQIERIKNSTATEQEKADKLKILEAERQAQKQANDRKNRQIEIARAKFDKQQNISSIISGTAVAVVNALGSKPFKAQNLALAATVGALGVAQLARAIAVPLPSYYKGTESSKAGLAITDEKGPELYIERSGKAYLGSDKGPTLRNLEQGTKIVPAHKVESYIESKMLHEYLSPGSGIIPSNEINASMNRAMMADTARKLQVIRVETEDSSSREIQEAIQTQTALMLREMRKQGRRKPTVNNIINLGWHQYQQKMTFN